MSLGFLLLSCKGHIPGGWQASSSAKRKFATDVLPLALQRLPPTRCKWAAGCRAAPCCSSERFCTARACTACGATTWIKQHLFCSTLCVLSRKRMCGMQLMHIWLSRCQLLAGSFTGTAAAAAAEHGAHCCHWQAALCPLNRSGMGARWCFPGDLLSGQLLQVGCVLITSLRACKNVQHPQASCPAP